MRGPPVRETLLSFENPETSPSPRGCLPASLNPVSARSASSGHMGHRFSSLSCPSTDVHEFILFPHGFSDMDLASTSSYPNREGQSIPIVPAHSFTHSLSACMKLLLRAGDHAGFGDLAMSSSHRQAHVQERGRVPRHGGRSGTDTAPPHGAGNPSAPGACAQAGFEGMGGWPRSPQIFTSFSELDVHASQGCVS